MYEFGDIDPQFFQAYNEIATRFLHQGGAAGLDFYDSLTLVAIELAIQSGDLTLPMSQEECENLPTGPVQLENVLPLAEKYPEFHAVARRWAFQKSPALFPQFHNA